ncbi:MAG: hypothetical protein ACKOOI_11940 [Pirellula sp.]
MNALLLKFLTLFLLWIIAVNPNVNAAVVSFHGQAPISYTSTIPGILKDDVFYFDLSIDDSVLDTDNSFEPNGFGGITSFGHFSHAITSFKLYSSPSNLGSFDPIGVTYDYSGSFFTTTDAGPGVTDTNHLEKIKFFIRVSSPVASGSPIEFVVLNLYNGTLYSPSATRQLWIDSSGSGNPTSFADFFLHGSRTLEEFVGVVPATGTSARDGIFLSGTQGFGIASGEGVSMQAVHEPSSFAIYGFVILASGIATRRRLRMNPLQGSAIDR